MTDSVARYVAPRVHEALDDTRIVIIQGSRQVGKSTLAATIARERNGRIVTLDDDAARFTAEADPVAFVAQHPNGLLVIDEVQRAPRLNLALKRAVDTDQAPGRFLLTGSADLLRLPGTEDSLAGRAESIELFGFSQGELIGHVEQFIDRLLSGKPFASYTSSLNRTDYMEIVERGSYPEALSRTTSRRRSQWLGSYATRVTTRDAEDVSTLRHLSELPRILKLVATRTATELNVTSVASDLEMPRRTLDPYLDLLDTLYLTQRIPAWHTNLTKQVVSRPKITLLDTGLAAHLLGTQSGASLAADRAGPLLETLVAGELRRQLGWCDESAELFHYRDRHGAEVDFILATPDGRIAGIEVKAASGANAHDARWLAMLRDRLGDRFVRGVVLHTGSSAGSLGDRITSAPIDLLWNA
ncbi:ATP-binding protein [Demequina sp. TTPB684]|uniref:ATP-binding protein n=1 Tax=unclassified Demequina TaxID=2620311 RepID=UPI001CF18ACB|nr:MULTISPECIES: ATP-binding protein [unclassified Demequina]MCB2412008.1 ATP-binding protein [Demequina sp. TTPB684]UPU88079.1 ATP-binding protein [Demequina sp. TMPB413]